MITPEGLPGDEAMRRVLLGGSEVGARDPAVDSTSAVLHVRAPGLSGRRLWERTSRWIEWGVPKWRWAINDRVDLALALRVSWVHLPARSLTPRDARRIVPGAVIVGVSVHDLAEARSASESGADYLMAGAVFATASHPGREPIGLEGLARIAREVSLPVLAVGGVTVERVAACREAGAWGVAAIRGIWEAADPRETLESYLGAARTVEAA